LPLGRLLLLLLCFSAFPCSPRPSLLSSRPPHEALTSQRRGHELPLAWPADVTYAPFLIWGTPDESHALRLRTARTRPLAGVAIKPLPAGHPAAAAAAATAAAAASGTLAGGAESFASASESGSPRTARVGSKGGFGLFASCTIPCGAWVGDCAPARVELHTLPRCMRAACCPRGAGN